MLRRIVTYSTIGLGIAVIILSAIVFFQHKKLQYERIFFTVDNEVELQLTQSGLPVVEKKIKEEGVFFPHAVAELKVYIPLSVSLDEVFVDLRDGFTSYKIQILKFKEENLKDTYNIHMELGREKVLTHKLFLSLEKAKVALLVDDFGYTKEDVLVRAFFEELSIPFTLSIIPGTPHAQEIAEKAYEKKKQILVHMPMQPKGDFRNEYRWIILEEMSEEEVEKQIREAIKSIPYAEGLNNHMGSLITTKRKLMQPVLRVLQEKDMFFLDSRTSPLSIGYSLAKELGVKSTYNCVFLDNEKEKEHIENQFKKLISQALDTGWALGLGHAHMTTASTLKKLIENCDTRKINFVLASEISK
ncbi:divergent polysaccharide deacetylase family protein [Candidatus Aerophobetes bacterium]|nr:divergent polysaccharide deacetylase family protein [Candidatus Aerophobetes bacterium]